MDGLIIEGKRLVRCNSTSSIITVPDGVAVIGKYAFACNNVIQSIVLPKSVKIIEKGAFFECKNLNSVEALNVKSIGESCFENCEVLNIVCFGMALKKIGKYAFDKCYEINFNAPANSFAEKYAQNNYIYCKSSQENEKISVKSVMESGKAAQKIKPMLNLNMIILGGSGTGKSRFFVNPNLMMCNTSFVVTDPSGELLQSCGKMLVQMGYEIKVFNLNDMKHSHSYNPFRYICDVGTEDEKPPIREASVLKMLNVLMANTKGEGEGGDPFWDNATKLLLSALCFLLVETGTEEDQNFYQVLDLIHKAHVDENKPDEKSELDLIFDQRAAESPDALSVKFYTEFKQAAGKTMQSILISTSTRLQNFNIKELQDLTNTDNIHLETIGDKKTALFLILPLTYKTYNFIVCILKF